MFLLTGFTTAISVTLKGSQVHSKYSCLRSTEIEFVVMNVISVHRDVLVCGDLVNLVGRIFRVVVKQILTAVFVFFSLLILLDNAGG